MARTITGPERSRLSSDHANFYTRVEVQDGAAAWRDLTNEGGVNYVQEVSWSESVDQPVASGSVSLKRESGGLSLSPFMDSSSLNRIGGVYMPLLNAGRGVRISTAVTLPGVAPITGDWKEVFLGTISDIDPGPDPLVLTIVDQGGVLTDTQIETQRAYGDAAGTPVEAVMQQILDDNLGAGIVTLYVPTTPTWNILPYTQAVGGLLDALRALALQIGWDVRYRYDAAGVSRLTLFSVDRAKTTPDFTIGPAEYINVPKLAISNADVRNVIEVSYQDKVSLVVTSVFASDAGSIAEFKRRYMKIGEGSSSNIDTAAEAQDMADAAVFDLAQPLADQSIEQFYFWPVQLGDLLAYLANGVHYNTDQLFGVIQIQHSLALNQHRTTIACRGRVAGAYRDWLLTRAGAFTGQISTGPAPQIFPLLAELQAFQDANRDGMAWAQARFEKGTDSIQFYALESATPGVPISGLSATTLAYELRRQEGDKWSGDDVSFIVPIATRPNYYRKIIAFGLGPSPFVLIDIDSLRSRGPTVVYEARAVDVGTGPTGPPSGLIITSADTTNRILWVNGDATAYTVIMRNGIGQVLQPGVTAFLDTNINTDNPYTYQIFHWKNGQSSSVLPSTGGGTTVTPPSSNAQAPTWDAGYPASVGINGVDFRWHSDPGTTEITLQVSSFNIVGLFTDLITFTDGGHVPTGVFTDTSQPSGTKLQARIKAKVGSDFFYSVIVNITYGVPPAVKPIFTNGTPYFDGSTTEFDWTLASTVATSLDILVAGIVVHHETNPATIQSGTFLYTSTTSGGKTARVRANYAGGITATSDIVIINTHTGGL